MKVLLGIPKEKPMAENGSHVKRLETDLIGFGFCKATGAKSWIGAWTLIFDFPKPSNSQT
jgi:hypothetical protein